MTLFERLGGSLISIYYRNSPLYPLRHTLQISFKKEKKHGEDKNPQDTGPRSAPSPLSRLDITGLAFSAERDLGLANPRGGRGRPYLAHLWHKKSGSLKTHQRQGLGQRRELARVWEREAGIEQQPLDFFP